MRVPSSNLKLVLSSQVQSSSPSSFNGSEMCSTRSSFYRGGGGSLFQWHGEEGEEGLERRVREALSLTETTRLQASLLNNDSDSDR